MCSLDTGLSCLGDRDYRMCSLDLVGGQIGYDGVHLIAEKSVIARGDSLFW